MSLKIFPIIIILLIQPASAENGFMFSIIGENASQANTIVQAAQINSCNCDNLKVRIKKLEEQLKTIQQTIDDKQ